MKRVIFIGQAMPRAKRDIYDWQTQNPSGAHTWQHKPNSQ